MRLIIGPIFAVDRKVHVFNAMIESELFRIAKVVIKTRNILLSYDVKYTG